LVLAAGCSTISAEGLTVITEGLAERAVRFLYPRKLKLVAAEFLQCHLIAGDFDLVNSSRKRCFNLDSVLVAEFVPAAHVTDKDSAI
jgi:hypothetical protein